MHFKHIAARLTAAMLLVGTLITPVSALTGTVTTEGSPLRLRSEANTESAILKNLVNGAQVEVLDAAVEGWYQVTYKGFTGYVSSEYLTISDEAAPAAQSAEVEDESSYVRVVDGPLNIRSGPTTDSEKVGSLSTGKVVEVIGYADGWYQVKSGYICAEYVTESSAEEAKNSGKGQEIANYALQYLGKPYVYGGNSPKGFDCSGLTSYVYKQCGYSINRTASGQLDNGRSVSKSELQPGDLVFFNEGSSKSRATHVGIYIGGNEFVHAANPRKGVVTTSMNSSYYSAYYIGARRVAG